MSAFKGVMYGLLTGVAIGLLTAPARGAETRQKLNDAADNVKKRFRRVRGIAGEELDQLREVFSREITGLQDDVRQRVLNLIDSSRESYQHVRREAMASEVNGQ